MSPLTNDERKAMRHALGLDQSNTAYRNRYASHGRSELWEGLCGKSVANRAAFGQAALWWYWVTREGCQAVLEPDEKVAADTSFDCSN